MTIIARVVLVLLLVCLWAEPGLTQKSSPITTTILEPAKLTLDNLFNQADTVALVRIVSGDTENYPAAVYKAVVVQSFKGADQNETIYFGPYIGIRLGWEYFVFLKNEDKPIAPKVDSTANYGTVRYARVFIEGMAALESSYRCVFPGTDPKETCDDAVNICTDYIELPKATPTFPERKEHSAFGCRWLRKSTFVSLLRFRQRSQCRAVARGPLATFAGGSFARNTR